MADWSHTSSELHQIVDYRNSYDNDKCSLPSYFLYFTAEHGDQNSCHQVAITVSACRLHNQFPKDPPIPTTLNRIHVTITARVCNGERSRPIRFTIKVWAVILAVEKGSGILIYVETIRSAVIKAIIVRLRIFQIL